MNECGLLEVPEAGDWMDLLAVRYNVLYDNVLYARGAAGGGATGGDVQRSTGAAYDERWRPTCCERLNLLLWVDRCWVPAHFAEHLDKLKAIRLEWYMLYHNVGTISSRPFYLPYVAFREYGDHLRHAREPAGGAVRRWPTSTAPITSCATSTRWASAQPFPTKAIYPPIFPGNPEWREYYRSRNLNLPHQYHNGGIWPFIGGFHVAALVKVGWRQEAANLLGDLAAAARLGVRDEWEFNEWLHGETGPSDGLPVAGLVGRDVHLRVPCGANRARRRCSTSSSAAGPG